MEKTTGQHKRVRQRRLLTAAFLLAFPALVASAPAKLPPAEAILALTVRSEEEICFTGQESGFVLEVPGVESQKIQTELSPLPASIQFQSSKREVYFDDEKLVTGTRIQLRFTFSETGEITIPPLIVTVANRRYHLPFQTVMVYENLATLAPELQVQFADTSIVGKDGSLHVTEGTRIDFTVSARYCVQLVQFNWKLPKNAIFSESSRTETADGAFLGKAFSPESHELASFSLTPLTAGISPLPEITMVAVAYNGMKRTVSLPPTAAYIEALPAEKGQNQAQVQDQEATRLFATAFSAPQEVQEETGSAPEELDCEKLASMRSAERHSAPGSKIRKQRAAYEAEAGITAPNEARTRVAQLFYALFSLALAAVAILSLRRHYKRATVSAALAVFILVACIHWTARLLPRHAIFAGGELRSIPELQTASSHSEGPGQRVRILEQAGDWCFIATPDASGWVLQESLYEIR